MTISFMTVIQNIIFARSLNKDTPLSQPSSPQREIRYHKPSFPRGAAAPSLARRGSHNTVTTQPSALRSLQICSAVPSQQPPRTLGHSDPRNRNRGKYNYQILAPGAMLGAWLLVAGHLVLAAAQAELHNYVLSDAFIESINARNSTWTAGR